MLLFYYYSQIILDLLWFAFIDTANWPGCGSVWGTNIMSGIPLLAVYGSLFMVEGRILASLAQEVIIPFCVYLFLFLWGLVVLFNAGVCGRGWVIRDSLVFCVSFFTLHVSYAPVLVCVITNFMTA